MGVNPNDRKIKFFMKKLDVKNGDVVAIELKENIKTQEMRHFLGNIFAAFKKRGLDDVTILTFPKGMEAKHWPQEDMKKMGWQLIKKEIKDGIPE